jgi:hypothetical protein
MTSILGVAPNVLEGLGEARVTRIRLAFEHASKMLDGYPIKRRSREHLPELIVPESRDSQFTIAEIAVRAVSKLPPSPSVAEHIRSGLRALRSS